MTTESVPIAHIPRAAAPPIDRLYCKKLSPPLGKLDGRPHRAPMIRGGWGGGPSRLRQLVLAKFGCLVHKLLNGPYDFPKNFTKVAQKYSKKKKLVRLLAHYILAQYFRPFSSRVRGKQFQQKIAQPTSLSAIFGPSKKKLFDEKKLALALP